jgi:hypothetical protein
LLALFLVVPNIQLILEARTYTFESISDSGGYNEKLKEEAAEAKQAARKRKVRNQI